MNPASRRLVLTLAPAIVLGGIGFLIGRSVPGPARPPAPADGKRAPLIGIASLTGEGYVQAVRESGGIPVVLPNTGGNEERIPDYLELLDGLLLPGGADIPPSEYGEEAHESVELLDEDRYEFEKGLVREWIEKTDKPLLGICLGSQWINVATGGTLVQDIPTEVKTDHRGTSHPITLESGSRLATILGTTELEVNSFHHQAADRIGKGLRAVAKAPDGVVEATETTDPDRFLIGVQWHPEKMMPDNEVQARLLKAFVEASAE
jgi:putative glutamine amidotransferase